MVEGVILAGGLSSRMGSDKSALAYNGRTLSEHMQQILTQAGLAPIRISGKDGTPDEIPGCGPVGGICTMIATSADSEGWLFVPVDMPLLQPVLLRRLMRESDGADAARFGASTLPLLVRATTVVADYVARVTESLRKNANFSVHAFLQPLRVQILSLSESEQLQFANINTPEEWRHLTEHGDVSAH